MFMGTLNQPFQDYLMTAMYTIKVTYCQHRSAVAVIKIVQASH